MKYPSALNVLSSCCDEVYPCGASGLHTVAFQLVDAMVLSLECCFIKDHGKNVLSEKHTYTYVWTFFTYKLNIYIYKLTILNIYVYNWRNDLEISCSSLACQEEYTKCLLAF